MQLAILGSVLVLGFLGSWHCGVMCGPLSCNFRSYQHFISYHLGRLVSYLVVGSLLFAGSQFLMTSESHWVKTIASFVFGILFLIFGLMQMNLLRNKNLFFKYYKFQFQILERFKNYYEKFPLVLGLLTGLFPCMWLYSFLLLASQSKTFGMSMMVIFLFWLSSLPAFMVMTAFMKTLIHRSPMKYQTLSGVVLIAAGLMAIASQWSNIFIAF